MISAPLFIEFFKVWVFKNVSSIWLPITTELKTKVQQENKRLKNTGVPHSVYPR